MVVLPVLSALIAFGCVALIVRDALRRPSPDRITWIVAFAMFGIAAAAEAIGDTAGWNAPLARTYYLTGAVLVVGFLALGQLYLLAGNRIGKVAPGIALLITAVSVSTVWSAPIDHARLSEDGWDAIERTTGLSILAISINSIGTLILLGGLGYSAIRFKRSGQHRNRMIGCLLIALGTLVVAMGGTLTRFGSEQYLYIAMSIGIAMIFGGYVWMKKPEARRESRSRGGGRREARRREAVRLTCPRTRSIAPLSASERLRLLSPGFQPRVMRDGGSILQRLPPPSTLNPQPEQPRYPIHRSTPGVPPR